MDISNANVWNAGWYSRMVEIRHCLYCGLVQRLPENLKWCPRCDMPGLRYFYDIRFLVKNIELYGLRNLDIVDEDIRKTVIEAFS